MRILLSVLIFSSALVSCQTTPYAPPATKANVEVVKVTIADFHGRPDIYADIRGRLTTNAAQLVDTKQSRGKGNVLEIEVFEQTPLAATATNRVPNPPFQTRVPLETLGLEPGKVYIVEANGAKTHFQMPLVEDNGVGGFFTSSIPATVELPSY